MRILLFYPNTRKNSLIPVAIGIFSRLLRDDGHKVELFDVTGYDVPGFIDSDVLRYKNLFFPARYSKIREKEDVFSAFRRKITEFSPDLIAVSVTESTFLIAITILKGVPESREIPKIFGGVFPTFAPERVLEFEEVDMVCVGEGDNLIRDLCRKIERGEDFSKIQGLWLKKKGGGIVKNGQAPLTDINTLPVPDYSLFDKRRFIRPLGMGRMWRMACIATHYGCPYTCGFCNSPGQNQMFTPSFFRKKEPKNVKAELINARDNYDVNYMFFWADTFLTFTKYEFDAFCEMYKEFKIPFWCQTRPETVAPDREGHRKLEKLVEIGLDWISFGVEHGNEDFRAKYVRRPYSNQLVIDSLRVPVELGIPFTVNNIIGFPHETRELALNTIELNRQIKWNSASCSIFTPYYGTEQRKDAEQSGFMDPKLICPSNSEDSVLRMPDFPLDQIKGLARTFLMYVKFDKSFWPAIAAAEKLTPEGDAIHETLSQLYKHKFFEGPESRIERVNTATDVHDTWVDEVDEDVDGIGDVLSGSQ